MRYAYMSAIMLPLDIIDMMLILHDTLILLLPPALAMMPPCYTRRIDVVTMPRAAAAVTLFITMLMPRFRCAAMPAASTLSFTLRDAGCCR